MIGVGRCWLKLRAVKWRLHSAGFGTYPKPAADRGTGTFCSADYAKRASPRRFLDTHLALTLLTCRRAKFTPFLVGGRWGARGYAEGRRKVSLKKRPNVSAIEPPIASVDRDPGSAVLRRFQPGTRPRLAARHRRSRR